MIPGIHKLISAETKMPVSIAKEPLFCVARGCAALLLADDLLDKVKIAKTAG